MKKLIPAIIAILLPLLAIAQTQQGYVKTKGRLNSNGTVTPGVRLSGATVVLKGGSSVVSGANGVFSMKVPANKYHLQNVKKNGYLLVDPEVLSKTYAYSTNPLVISMETPDEQSADKLANERKIRRTLQRTLQQREDEIEALKEQNKISEEEYRKALQKIYDEQGKNEKLISEMAEQYSKIDYDLIDDFDREFNQYILNGELTKADSLLNTKGDINKRINDLNRDKQILDEEEKELAQRQDNLEKGKAYYSQKLEDIANDCYKKYERFKIEYKNDSAAYYLELRASLDTTNIMWQLDAGVHIHRYRNHIVQALNYYNRALRNSIDQPNAYSLCLSALGQLYSENGKFSNALNCFLTSLELNKQIYGENDIFLSFNYNQLGQAYFHLSEYDNALKNFNLALKIQLAYNETEQDLGDVSMSYNGIGCVYLAQGNLTEALNFHQKALEIDLQHYDKDPRHVASSYNCIGEVYFAQGKYAEALNYSQKALEIRLQVYGESHPDVANSYNNIGIVYSSQSNYTEALNYYKKALEIRLHLFGENHPDVANSYNNIGSVLDSQGNYNEALNYFQKALEIRLYLFGENHPDVANCYYGIAGLNYALGDYINTITSCDKSLNFAVGAYGNENPGIKQLYMYKYSAYCKLVKQDASYISYLMKFMENIVFTVTMVEGDTPASKQGLKGEYYLFEFGDWDMESLNDLFDKNTALKGKPKTLILMKDGNVSTHYFENSIGCQLGVKWVSKEEKKQILEQYRKWKESQN